MLNIPKPPDATAPSAAALRIIALGRRVAASPALVNTISDLAYGTCRRDDVVALHAACAARVAAAMGTPS